MWKFCRKAQFPHIFQPRKLGEITVFFTVTSISNPLFIKIISANSLSLAEKSCEAS